MYACMYVYTHNPLSSFSIALIYISLGLTTWTTDQDLSLEKINYLLTPIDCL